MARSQYVYVTYIRTTPEKLWAALTTPEFIKQFWFGMNANSAFTTGAPWSLVSDSGELYDSGEILEADPPRKLVIRWTHQKKPELTAEGPSICTMELTPDTGAVKLQITHTIDAQPSKLIEAVSGGWPKVLSNLKSLLETGAIALQEPYPKKD